MSITPQKKNYQNLMNGISEKPDQNLEKKDWAAPLKKIDGNSAKSKGRKFCKHKNFLPQFLPVTNAQVQVKLTISFNEELTQENRGLTTSSLLPRVYL